MNILFYTAAAVAVIATALVITRKNAVHALLYLIVSFLAVALIFLTLGAPFVAALEIIIYAGAIMVLFVFVIMMLNLNGASSEQERAWLAPRVWKGPALLCLVLAAELAYLLAGGHLRLARMEMISPKRVAIALFGPYALGVELASMLLLAGLVGAYHLGRQDDGTGGRDKRGVHDAVR
jgi:NADH-quinone oxidoreductase subunit J